MSIGGRDFLTEAHSPDDGFHLYFTSGTTGTLAVILTSATAYCVTGVYFSPIQDDVARLGGSLSDNEATRVSQHNGTP